MSLKAKLGAGALIYAGFGVALIAAPGLPVSYSPTAPTVGPGSIANYIGAVYDANNIGGNGINSSQTTGGGNGNLNDAYTYVGNNQPAQGQTFLTGSDPSGYLLDSISVQITGYADNNVIGTTGSPYDQTFWGLATGSTFNMRVGTVSGTGFSQIATASFVNIPAPNNPGSGASKNGPGTWLTFTFLTPIALTASTEYGFDLSSVNTAFFEWLGLADEATNTPGIDLSDYYAGGTAYNTGADGVASNLINPLGGDRVFELNIESAPEPSILALGVVGGLGALMIRKRAKTGTGSN